MQLKRERSIARQTRLAVIPVLAAVLGFRGRRELQPGVNHGRREIEYPTRSANPLRPDFGIPDQPVFFRICIVEMPTLHPSPL
jgi:hypothetical protein